MQITAAVARQKGSPLSVETLELDQPRANEILVQIVAVGVCHTDISMRNGNYPVPFPIVLGHEGAGIVVQTGEGITKVAPGDHVTLSYATDGTCLQCEKGYWSSCQQFYPLNFGGSRPDGSKTLRQNGTPVSGNFFGQSSFATYALVSERNVVKLPKTVPLELVGPLGCGIGTGAGAVLNSLKPVIGSSIAIFGCGAVGLSAVMAAKVASCGTIVAIDTDANRLALARELGATHGFNPVHENVVEHLQAMGGMDYSLEITGIPSVFRQAVEVLKVPGTCGSIGGAPFGTDVCLDMGTILFGRTVRGIIMGDSIPDVFIPQLIALYNQGRFPFDRLITFYPFDQINQAIEDMLAKRAIKPVLRLQPAVSAQPQAAA